MFSLLVGCASPEELPTLEIPWSGGTCIELWSDDTNLLTRWATIEDAMEGSWHHPPAAFEDCRLDPAIRQIRFPTDVPDGDYQLCTPGKRVCQSGNVHSLGR